MTHACKNVAGSNTYLPNPATDPYQQLANLESEITRVNALLRQLVQNCVPLKREINSRFVPILQLPPEILGEIFNECLSSNIWDDEDISMSPLVFGRVCSSWRKFAFSMPRLWSSIQLNLDEKSSLRPALVEEWLLRSGKMPLSIYVICRLISPSPTVLAVLDVLTRNAERWSCIALDLCYLCYETLQSVRNRLPNLQYISLRNATWEWDEMTADLDIFRVAPRLRNVFLESYHPQALVLPTDQLTKLSVECYYIDKCMSLLRCCPHITDCTLGCLVRWNIGEVHVHAAQLQSLQLSIAAGITSEVFNCLTIPAIRHLSCSLFEWEDEFPRTNFTSLISRSSCSLQTLSLQNFRISDVDFIECMRAVPSLCELSIINVHISNQVFRMLDPSHPPDTDTSGTVLPNLKAFEYAGDLNLDFVILTNFLHSRWEREESTGPLTISRLDSAKFSMHTTGAPDPPLLTYLQNLAQRGMSISLVTRSGSWP